MSEYADRHSHSHRKERVDHVLGSTKSGAVDASGYTVPGELDTQRKTGPYQPKPRAFAKGGKVEGRKAHHHAGRKPRDSGGGISDYMSNKMDAEGAKRNLEDKGYYKTFSGDPSENFVRGPTPQNAKNLEFEKSQGSKDPYWSQNYTKGGTAKNRKSRDAGGETAIQQLRPNVPTSGLYGSGFSPTHAGLLSSAGGLKKGGDVKKRSCGGKSGERRLEMEKAAGDKRKARAEGGRAKGKTNINIIIGAPKQDAVGPAVPPPPSAMPPKPGLPPAALGAMAGAMPPMGGPGPAAQGMPPQMPPGMGPRA